VGGAERERARERERGGGKFNGKQEVTEVGKHNALSGHTTGRTGSSI
jgi:hypothetical protein